MLYNGMWVLVAYRSSFNNWPVGCKYSYEPYDIVMRGNITENLFVQ